MAETITEWNKRQFNDNVKQVYGTMETVASKYIVGDMVHTAARGVLDDFDVVGQTVARTKTDRHEDTIPGEVEKSRRWCRPYKAYQALWLDNMDKVRVAISNVNSIHTKAIVQALKHEEDSRFFTAAIGTAINGENATGTAAFPPANIIPLGTTPDDVLTLTKIKSVSAKMDEGGVPDEDGKRHWCFAPGNKNAIMGITQAASSDFYAGQIYASGNINGKNWMGFSWHMIADQRSQGSGSGDSSTSLVFRMLPLSGTQRTNIVFANDAIGKTSLEELLTEMDKLPLKTYSVQVYGEIDLNFVRVLDAGVMSVLTLDELAS